MSVTVVFGSVGDGRSMNVDTGSLKIPEGGKLKRVSNIEENKAPLQLSGMHACSVSPPTEFFKLRSHGSNLIQGFAKCIRCISIGAEEGFEEAVEEGMPCVTSTDEEDPVDRDG